MRADGTAVREEALRAEELHAVCVSHRVDVAVVFVLGVRRHGVAVRRPDVAGTDLATDEPGFELTQLHGRSLRRPVPSCYAPRMSNEIPRRIRLDKMVPAERACFDAIQAIELLPADPRLTLAQTLITEAQRIVADHVDGLPLRLCGRAVTPGGRPCVSMAGHLTPCVGC